MIPTDWPLAIGFAAETTLGVTLLVMLVLALRRPVAKRFGAGAAYALWSLPLIRLVLPPLPSGWTIWPTPAAGSGETVPLASHSFEGGVALTQNAPSVVTAEFSAALPSAPIITDTAMSSPINWPLVAATFWAIGVCVALVLTMYRHRKFMQVVDAETEATNGRLEMLAADVAAEIGLRRKVRISSSLISSGPMVTGLVRPTVLLPVWFEDDYTRSEQRAAIAHELTHVKRKDLWMLQFAHIAMAFQWFNPVAHWALRAFRSDQEAACDADVLRCTSMSPRAYGETLVKAVKLSAPNRRRLMTAGLPLTYAIKDRLVLMQTPQPSFRKKLLGGGLTAIFGAFALVATASAHPTGSKGITISDGELTIDGKTYKDRRFVLLDEPFENTDFQFEFEGNFEELGEALAEEGEAIAEMFEDMDFSAFVEFDDLDELSELAELNMLTELPGMIEGFVSEVEVTTLDDGSTQIVIPKRKIVFSKDFSAIEKYADKMALRAEAMSERDAHLQQRHLQQRLAALEERAEHLRMKAEAHADVFASEFEAHIEPTTNAIDALANACVGEELKDGNPVLFEREIQGEKRSIKALCLKGQNGFQGRSIEDFLADIPEITEAQRRRVIEELTGNRSYRQNGTELLGADRQQD